MKVIPDIIHNADVQQPKRVKVYAVQQKPQQGRFTVQGMPNPVPSPFQVGKRATGYFGKGDFINGKIIDICRNSFPNRYKMELIDGRVLWTDEVYPPE